ncbi:ribonuclease HI, degrades RNA of DNA-RNA hybrids (modular protein) [Syntrophobacter sp. SbD1]|nr:ribonuclease HI, degrades RNA of DNA-RNA hybrids (modular protein) [Syntrophobacter sp. SbD1]
MSLRNELVNVVLRWEDRYGCFPGQAGVTAAVSEYDAAMLLGCSESEYADCLRERTAVSSGYDFLAADGQRIQVKANRPSGNPGSAVWNAGSKVKSIAWDILIYVLYDQGYKMLEAWKFTPELYERLFAGKSKLSIDDMRKGIPLHKRHSEVTDHITLDGDSSPLGQRAEGQPILIFTDGACQGNPGPGGWGVVIKNGEVTELSGSDPHTTNNKMELTAAIKALQSLQVPSTVVLTTDSQYMKNGITLWIHNWKRNGWRTAAKKPVLNADLWHELDALNQQHEVDWRWVKGHSGHPENERCDQLANEAILTMTL